MDTAEILRFLEGSITVDLTTRGARTGLPRRIEIWGFVFEGRYVITGTPGPRDWFANVSAHPEVIVHLDGRDLPGTARIVTDRGFRRRFFEAGHIGWYRDQVSIDRLVAEAPMIEIAFG